MNTVASTLEYVTSRDGTRIACQRSGEGQPLVLVHGTTGAHWSFNLLLPSLVGRFTVYSVDRRGRGESGDREEYAIEWEFEDVAAVVDSIGKPATLFGHSYGATLALGAALLTDNVHRLILNEPAPGSRRCRPRTSSGWRFSWPETSPNRRSSTLSPPSV